MGCSYNIIRYDFSMGIKKIIPGLRKRKRSEKNLQNARNAYSNSKRNLKLTQIAFFSTLLFKLLHMYFY